jgi:glutamate 5-kinase
MRTKIEAAQLAQRAGTTMIIADGAEKDVLLRILDGERIGTRFLPLSQTAGSDGREDAALFSRLESRKRWIMAGSRAVGCVYVDRGAALAIVKRGKSLLAVGIVDVAESFERGETVRIFLGDTEIARGVIRYAASELAQIKGLRSGQIRKQLGYDYGDEIVHHNDMVILRDLPRSAQSKKNHFVGGKT